LLLLCSLWKFTQCYQNCQQVAVSNWAANDWLYADDCATMG
jgi:hypothetical protein